MNNKKAIKSGIPDCLLCASLALAFTAAPSYIQNGYCKFSGNYFVNAAVLFFIFLFSAHIAGKLLLSLNDNSISGSRFCGFVKKGMESKCSVIIFALVIFICWIPTLVCLYPGTLINDSWKELTQFIQITTGNGFLNDHNPVFDSLFMGVMIVPLSQATGHWHAAIFIFVICQSLLTCFAFSDTLVYAYRKLNISIKGITFFLLVYCLLLIYPMSAQTVSKDAIHSWVFVFYSRYFIETVRSEGLSLNNKRFFLVFFFLSILCCLTKKVGIFVTVLSLCGLFIFIKNHRIQILTLTFSCFLLMMVILPILFDKYNVIPGGKQEMFSLPFQMTARYVKYYGDDVTEEERTVISRVLDYDHLAEKYDPIFADLVKGYSQRGKDQDYIDYLKVWFRHGLRHPNVYLAAVNNMLSGWFSWYKYYPLMNMGNHSQLDSRFIPEWVPFRTISNNIANHYQDFINGLYENPLSRLFFTYGFYASLIPAFILSKLTEKSERKSLRRLVILPLFLSLVLGCWLSPASVNTEGRRYLYPLTYTSPLLLMWCLYIHQER